MFAPFSIKGLQNSKNLSTSLLFLIVLICDVQTTPVQEAPVQEGRQGILEIPKQAATIIRNFVDRNIQYYLNITTPKPDLSRPSITDSIIGHYLFQNFGVTVAPATPYKDQLASTTQMTLFTSNSITYRKPSETKPPAPAPPAAKQPIKAPPLPPASQSSSGTTQPPAAVHSLDKESFNTLYNSYGVLLTNTTDSDEVYFINPTRESVVIPIKSTSTTTEATTVDPDDDEVTTPAAPGGAGGDEDEDNEDSLFEFKIIR